ncbi:30S ribosomal protein S8 [Patescibacteria group bacterium]|nr:MAG: 30S ribosomal protein S8 [Patescibacteria group bacterium]
MTDPIADLLTRIRNASRVGKTEIELPASRLKFEIAKILEKEGYLSGVDLAAPGRVLRLALRYEGRRPAIRDLRRLSKPGRRLYVGWQEIPRVMSGLGVTIVSTSQGLMTGGEARARKLGGELVCEIY